MQKKKTVILGVTGSIAAYKIANLASMLVKYQYDVHVVMTKNAVNFINPITFETLTGNKCLVDTFDRNFEFNIAHVSLSQKADIFLIAPASANIMGKIANGIADDMLSTMAMAATCKILISPAMNTWMYKSPAVQRNIKTLLNDGRHIIEPATGVLACGDEGIGKMPSENILFQEILHEIAFDKDLKGKKILITAGPTQESLDPVRFITNHSTGKMGYSLAKIAALRGAEVTLISGPVHIEVPQNIIFVPVKSANDMYEEVLKHFQNSDIVIKAAAVADYRPALIQSEKIKKSEEKSSISLERTKDILFTLGQNKLSHQLVCGFAMETEKMLEYAKEKLVKKNADLIVANHLREEGAGFGVDTNIITLITKDNIKQLPLLSKEEAAIEILDCLKNMMLNK